MICRIAAAICAVFACNAGSWWVCDCRADDEAFSRQVAPILERRCLACHNSDTAKGGLSLSTSDRAIAGGESGPALLPSDPDGSLLVQYVSGSKPAMPKQGPPLAATEVTIIRRWIAEGAHWPADRKLVDRRFEGEVWWSLAPLQRPIPPPSDSGWIRTPIDAFILAELGRQGLSPSPEADRRTLLRRLAFDLHGLPPTPEDLDAFTADATDEAYPRVVDRLLASPRYGERWGRHWLDVVHFGETHGYDKDKVRPNAWPYRDYVIRSLNADKPYSRFVQEQLAGDVLFADDPQAVVATGFIAAGPWDFVGHVELREGTTDKEIARANDRDDMVATTASTFLSMTAHCARCHDHKFDPIPQADYYRLQAVFAGVDRADRPYDTDPAVAIRRAQLHRDQELWRVRHDAFQERLRRAAGGKLDEIDAAIGQAERELAGLPPAGSPSLGYHSSIEPSAEQSKWVQVDLAESQALDRVVLVPAHVAYGGHPGPGFGFPPRFKVEVSHDVGFAVADTIADETLADFPNPGDAPYSIDAQGKRGRYIRVTATRLWKRTDDWIFALAELSAIRDQKNLAAGAAVTSLDSIEAPPSWTRPNLVDGFSSREPIDAPAGSVTAQRHELLARISTARREREDLVLSRLDRDARDERRQIASGLATVEQELASLPPQGLVYGAASRFAPQGSFTNAARPRPIHLLLRGNVQNPGPLMSPGALTCVVGQESTFTLPDPNDEGSRRAALARWITDPGNVLAQRSIVNRVWQYHFGRGLVDTPNDFGRMGSLPTHPELLDWLAVEFRESGESLKRLHKLLVTSAVYRQASASRPEGERLDSGNRFLWRMNRARLEAEEVRDAVLAVSGKLDLTEGGPSARQFVFKDDHSPIYDYERFDVDDPAGFRRCVFRFIVRSVPDPFMECLDCADPSILTPKRNTTLTALQALSMLNNRFVVRQSQHFAHRLEELSVDGAVRIQAAYRLALGRLPDSDELRLMEAYAEKHGLANACRVLLNSNEFLFVD